MKPLRQKFTLFLLLSLIVREGLIKLIEESYTKKVTMASFSNDKESLLARGIKIPFSEVDLYDLQSISGITVKEAVEILDKRDEILSTVDEGGNCERLKLVHGIGEKKAERVCEVVDLGR